MIQQGEMTARGNEAVLWVDRDLQQGGQQQRITVYLDGAAAVDFQRGGIAHPGTGLPAQSIRDRTWFGHLATRMPIDIRVPDVAVDPKERPAVYQRGVQAFDRAVGHVQLAQLTVQTPAEPLAQPPLAPITGMQKRIQVGPRSNALIHIKSFPGAVPNQSVTVFSNGIRAVIEGIEAPQLGHLGRIVIETDRLVSVGTRI